MRRKFIIAAALVGIIVGSGGSSSPAGPLSVTITGSPTIGPATLTTSFASVPVGGVPPYSYAWVWGDGTANGTTQNPNHNFTVAGAYTTTLTVTDSASHTASQVKTVLATGAAYYVAKSGNDSNNGTSPATPFLTLTKCQTAMRTGDKVCIVNDSGTYTLGASLTFNSSDNGEVWTAGFGQTPVIDGNSDANAWDARSASNMSVYGLTFQHMGPAPGEGGFLHGAVNIGNSGNIFRWNTLLNPTINGFFANFTNLSNTTIDSNIISGLSTVVYSASQFPSAIDLSGSEGNNTITHNLCQNLTGACVELATSATGQSNTTINYNLALNVTQGCADCGVVHIYDTSNGSSPSLATGNVVEYNAIYSNANPAFFIRALYLDNGASNIPVKYNVVASYDAGTNGGQTNIGVNTVAALPGQACFSLGAPSTSNTIENNICEMGAIPLYGNWFDCGQPTSFPFTSCTNKNDTGGYMGFVFGGAHTIDHNIVFTRNSWPGGMWAQIGSTVPDPTINSNVYYSKTATTFPPASWNSTWTWRPGSGNFKGSSYVTTNPGFIDPSHNNYQVTNPPSGWVTLPTNQGPVNSPFVAAGSTF